MLKLRAVKVVAAASTAALLYSVVTFIPYARAATGEDTSTRVATWARDHYLGHVVDWAEQRMFSSPPANSPALRLEVSVPSNDTVPITAIPPYEPVRIVPVVFPELKNEGVWRAIATASGNTEVWTTGDRPLAKHSAVLASYAVIDQDRTRAELYNGPEIPGGSGWVKYRKVPASSYESLVATFNGGFRLEHSMGGYYTEGRLVQKLRVGAATLAIDSDGKVHVGKLGRDIKFSVDKPNGYVSLRQNINLLVDAHRNVVGKNGWQFGAWSDGNLFIMRSSICERRDGKLMYAIVGKADATQLADVLVRAGCERAMELDVNSAWPKFMSYSGGVPHKLDRRSTGRDDLYLHGSSKEFVALFRRDISG
jgi:hypothetical protein